MTNETLSQTAAARPADPAPRRRSLREFLFEILVVVIGVLIALGAQQVADALHWRAEVADARRALDKEITRNLGTIRGSMRQDVCKLAHLDALEAWAKESLEGRAGANPNQRFRSPGTSSFQTSAWDVAKASQVAGHFPLNEQLVYAQLYSGMENQQYVVLILRDYWRALTGFADKPSLSAADASRLLELISITRQTTRIYHGNAPGLIESSKKLGGVEPPAQAPFNAPADCAPKGSDAVLGSPPLLGRP
jgi:hypothetical protein